MEIGLTMNNKIYFGIFVIAYLIIGIFPFVSSAEYDEFHKLNPSTGMYIKAFEIVKEVQNGGSKAIFIPVKTEIEWSNFRTNYPDDVSVSNACLGAEDCMPGLYCDSNHDCATLPLCAEGNVGSTGHNPQESDEDLWGQCPGLACTSGNCVGGSYACHSYNDGLQHGCSSGYVCEFGSCVESGCTSNSDCGFNEYCNVNNDCVDCSVPDLCQMGYSWDSAQCRCVFCFIGKTQVLMADGTYKRIDEVEVGELVQGENEVNEVLEIEIHDFKDELYSINGGDYFVTEEHPFKSLTGWKAINPNKLYEEDESLFRLLDPKVLKVGDILFTEDGLVVVKRIDSKQVEKEIKVYNLKLDGDHLYYADGYLVHNEK